MARIECRKCGAEDGNDGGKQWVCGKCRCVNWDGDVEGMGRYIAIDLDGTLHAYSRGWQGDEVYDVPQQGAVEAVKELRERGYSIIVFTVRADLEKVEAWIEEWFGEGIAVTNQKPGAWVFIDDRGYRHEGDWENTVRDIIMLAEKEGHSA